MREEAVNSAVIGGHFDQVPIRIPEIDGGDRSLRAGSANRPLYDLHPVSAKTSHHIRHRRGRDQTKIRRSRDRPVGLGVKFMAHLMEIDFLIAKYKGLARTVEHDFAYAEDLRIKSAGGGDVAYRQNDMVDSVYADLGRHG